ncbi:MAG: SNF2-related protein, partial [Saprospiraceae bacterium]
DVLLEFPADDLIAYLAFHKTDSGIEYRLQLGSETEKWTISDREVIPLTNTDPAWLLVDYTLRRVPGINGNMVRPFRKKDLLQIPPDKERLYFRQFIAKSIRRSRVEAQGFSVRQTDSLQITRLETMEGILDGRWLLRPVFEYSGAEFLAGDHRDRVTTLDIPTDEQDGEVTVHLICRDHNLEKERLASLERLGLEADNHRYFVPGTGSLEAMIAWLALHQAALAAAGFQVIAPQVEERRIALLNAELQLRSRATGDWFDVQGDIQAGEFRFPFRALLPYLRRLERYFPLPDGSFLLLPEAWFARYADLAGAVQESGEQLRLPKALYTLLQNAGPELPAADLPETDPESLDYTPSDELKAELRPYQLQGVKWLIGHYRQGFGACLADDMGLGKTLQTIALLLYVKSADQSRHTRSETPNTPQLDLFQSHRSELRLLNALIILPASLVFNWQKELAKFAPSLFVYVHTGPGRLKDARHLAGQDVVLTTYHTARQDLKLLEKVDWQFIILDESQQIKNHRSEVSKVV